MNNVAWAIVVLAGAVLFGMGAIARDHQAATGFGALMILLGLIRMLWFHGDPD